MSDKPVVFLPLTNANMQRIMVRADSVAMLESEKTGGTYITVSHKGEMVVQESMKKIIKMLEEAYKK